MFRLKLMFVVPVLFTVGSLLAQEVDEAEDADKNKNVLEEIVVTATKREKSVREIPLSIDAFSGSDLDERGLTSLSEILNYSPGVTLISGENPDSNQINIRGAGSSSGDFNRPFGIFYEDVPLINPTFGGAQPDMDPFDLATVEILKGPQGTLFGGSALVGAIRYVPNRPSFDSINGSVSFGYGNTSESDGHNKQYTAMLNLPLGDTFAIRFAGSVRDTAGFIDDTYSGEKDINGVKTEQRRVMALWEPVTDLSFRFTYQDRMVDADSTIGNIIDNEEGRQETGALRSGADFSDSDLEILGLNIDWNGFENFTLSMINNRLRKDANFSSNEIAALLPGGLEILATTTHISSTDQWTHELRMVSNQATESTWALFRDWEYVAGLFYMKSEQVLDIVGIVSIVNPPIPILTAIAHLQGDAEEKAFYFDATRQLFDSKLELNIGGRYFDQSTPVLLQVSGNPDEADTLKEEGFNPKAALTWHFTDNVSSFVGASKGFRFGGVNADPFLSGEPPPFYESDSLWNYELGLRTDWMNSKLQLDLTAFYIDWTNKQMSQSTSAAIPSEYIANTGGSESKGMEFSFRTLLSHGFSWLLNGAYVNSKTTEDFYSPSGGILPAGTVEPNTSKWTGATVLDYNNQWRDWDIGGSLAYAYRSKPGSRFQNDVPLPAVETIDLSFRVGNSSWKLAPFFNLYVTNLTNDQSLVSGVANGPASDPNRQVKAQTVRPRTVMLNMTLSF